jgi:hypothetical protein
MIKIITTRIKRIAFGMILMKEKLEIITRGINIICIIKEVRINEIKNDKILLFIFLVIFS